MKKLINVFFIVIGIIVISLFAIRSWTKSHSPVVTKEAKINKLVVNITYSSPQKNNRKIFGELVPYETVWRTGANEATTITFSKNCTFGGRKVKAGSYSLWSIPGKRYWEIILNNETGQWGTNYDQEKDYLRFRVLPIENLQTVENLTIDFEKKEKELLFNLKWENTALEIPIGG